MTGAATVDINPARSLGEVLGAFGIETSVAIDDAFGVAFGDVWSVIGPWVEQGQADSLTALPHLGGRVVWLEGEELARSDAESAWEKLCESERSEVAKAVGCDVASANAPAPFDDLDRLLPGHLRPERMTLVEWQGLDEARRTELSGADCLLFVDLDFGGRGSSEGGAELLAGIQNGLKGQRAHGPVGVILTNHAGPEGQGSEEGLWQALIQKHGLSPNLGVVVGKARLKDPEAFVKRLRIALMNNLARGLGIWSRMLAEEAANRASADLGELDGEIVEAAVLRSSEREGVLPVETLLRLFDRFILDRRFALAMDEHGGEFRRHSERLAALARLAEPEAKTSLPRRLQRLRHRELYRTDLGNLSTALPPWLGDIFEVSREGGDVLDHYVLVEQPCDLALRPSGTRAARTCVLLPIEASDHTTTRYKNRLKKHNSFSEQDIEDLAKDVQRNVPTCHRLEYFDPKQDGEYAPAWARFKKARIAELAVLDLVALMGGTLRLEGPPQQAYTHFLPGVCKRTDELRKRFADDLPRLFPGDSEPDAKKEKQPDDSTVTYFVKRVSRLAEPEAIALLRRYMEFRARAALPHDFVILE